MITDLLTYNNGEALADQENWSSGLGSIICTGSAVYNNALRSIVYNTLLNSANQRARIILDAHYLDGFIGVGRIGPALRCNGNNGYTFLVGAGSLYISRIVNGVEQIIKSFDSNGIGFESRDLAIDFTAEGTTLKGFVNGFLKLEVEDSTFTSGYTGIAGRNADSTIAVKSFSSQNIVDFSSGTFTISGENGSIIRRIGKFLFTRNTTWKFDVTRNDWKFKVTRNT